MKMKFGDFEFPSNPAYLEIISSTNVSSKPVFNENSRVENVSVNPSVVKGNGEFYGDDAEESCSFLQHMLRQKLPAVLFLPSESSLNAYLSEFCFSKSADKSSVCYSFVFTENCNDKKESCDLGFTCAEENDNAFKIANRFGVSVSDIMKNNDFKTPFDINEGERVVLNEA